MSAYVCELIKSMWDSDIDAKTQAIKNDLTNNQRRFFLPESIIGAKFPADFDILKSGHWIKLNPSKLINSQ